MNIFTTVFKNTINDIKKNDGNFDRDAIFAAPFGYVYGSDFVSVIVISAVTYTAIKGIRFAAQKWAK